MMTMSGGQTVLLAALLLLAQWAAGGAAVAQPPAGRLQVVKEGERVYVRSSFSPTHEVVVVVGKGTNRQINFEKTVLVPMVAGTKADDLTNSQLIHGNGDDSTPWNLNGTYIGANHGCSDSRVITCENHGLTTADLGSEWADGAGTKFYVLKIPDGSHFWVLSANSGTGDIWKFNGKVVGPTLKRTRDGATLTFTEAKMVQLTPACRINSQQYLVNGTTPLVEGQAVEGESFDIVEDYDVISPAGVLADYVAHPGEERSFVAPGLPAVVSNHIIYRFLPNGANVIYTTSQAKQDFNIGYMGFIQSAKLSLPPGSTTHQYYIPKTLPFEAGGKTWDFQGQQDYLAAPPVPLNFAVSNNNVSDPGNLPDRFVQLLGHREGEQTVHDVGYALGYSLVQGMTVPAQRAANAGKALMLYTSAKSYPTAVDAKMGQTIKAGTSFECVGYRQYFWPGAYPQTTCCYWHQEGNETLLYVDYHRAVERDVLRLPGEFTGRKLRVVEKTPSVTVHTGDVVPAEGLVLSVAGSYGSVVVGIR
ncbi:MAG: hypothetical protein ABFE08_19460 [Armatimonadia bacterium]